ncbi:LysR family transcriptional regulator [Paraburkholderia humisilvae]|uniref:HTH-type transcriptional regulator LeuO n=1 Tax=Paraburkholderia humisilvae TaxID=627669 RepID=A0A6J5DV91_9BURK|nr:LysR family transcriptional regulator [Paraburkholderia humisilvae]CAB3757201.1 HTH-type transcriptional regulator LeuO [Paraburkholderia humisilvae]
MNFRTLDLNLLKVFEALMSEGAVTRAAAKLSLTQPAVSNALSRLREAFDDPLFVRNGAGVTPTQRAIALWGPVGESLSRIRAALDEETFSAETAQASFSLSMSDYVAGIVMPRLVARFGVSAPGLRFHSVPNMLVDAPTLLEDNRVDCLMGVYVNETLPPAYIRSRSLWTVDYACLMRRDHPLASAGRLTTRRFLNAPHVDISLAGQTLPSFDIFLASRGLKRNLVTTVNHYTVASEMIRASDLIAVMPRDLCERFGMSGELVGVRAPLEAPERVISLFWHQRNETVPAHRWLREQLVGMFGERDARHP